MNRLLRLTLVIILFNSLNLKHSNAQFYEVDFNTKVNNSQLFVEGEVIESTSYEAADGKLYTSHRVNVFNWVYPQNTLCNTLSVTSSNCFYVITKGGQTDTEVEHWSHSLTLNQGDIGLFMLTKTARPVLYSDVPSYEVYSGYQGFTRYNLDGKNNFHGGEIFNEYQNPDTELIAPIYQTLNIPNPPQSFIRNNWELYFSVYDIQLINTAVNMEIGLKSKWGNNFKIKDLTTKFKYDTSIFGTNALNNGDITITLNNDLQLQGITMSVSQIAPDAISIDFNNTTPTIGAFIEDM